MTLKDELAEGRARWSRLTFYEKFEHVVIMVLETIIAIVVVAAVWNLALKVVFGLILAGSFDPTDYTIFQTVFGMIFTVIIALEFKKSLTVMAERRSSIVQVRTVILIALLAVVRKVMLLDVTAADAAEVIALAAAILALGAVNWLVRDTGNSGKREVP
jgi:uncharacterized membrane protein (DUF373 family)